MAIRLETTKEKMGDDNSSSPRGLLPILGVVVLSVLAVLSSYQQLSPFNAIYRDEFRITSYQETTSATSTTAMVSARVVKGNHAVVPRTVSSNDTSSVAVDDKKNGSDSVASIVSNVVTAELTPESALHKSTTANVTFWTRVPLESLQQNELFVMRKHDDDGAIDERLGIYERLTADFRVCEDLDLCPVNKTAYAHLPAHRLLNDETKLRIFARRIDKNSKTYRVPKPNSFLAVTYYNDEIQRHVPFIVKDEINKSKLKVKMCEGQACPIDCSHKQKETNSDFPYYWDKEDHLCRSTNPVIGKKYGGRFHCTFETVCFTPEAVEDTELGRNWPWQNTSERALYHDDTPKTREQNIMIQRTKKARMEQQEYSEYKPRFDCHNEISNGTIPLPIHAGFEHHFIFIPKAKLIFCGIPKVGITEWHSFLRFVNGAKDYLAWPHGKKDRDEFMLQNLSPEKASELLRDPAWTKAVFIRDPAERLLSAYLNKVVNEHFTQKAFHIDGDVKDKNFKGKKVLTFEEFVGLVTMTPNFVDGKLENIPIGHGLHAKTDPHWRPQSMTCGLDHLLPHFEFVGNFNYMSQQTKQLLDQVGMWDDYGAKFDNGNGNYRKGDKWMSSGPLQDGDIGYNASRVVSGFNQRGITGQHATNSRAKLEEYYTPGLMERVRRAYTLDFAIFDELQSRAEKNVEDVPTGRSLKAVQAYCEESR